MNNVGGGMITVSAKGKVMLKKGLARGADKVKVKLTAAANDRYLAAKARIIALTVVVR